MDGAIFWGIREEEPQKTQKTQNIENGLRELIAALNQAEDEQGKQEAKSRLKEFLTHPLTCGILTSSLASLLGLLG